MSRTESHTKIKKITLIVSLSVLVLIGSIAAFLTSTDSAKNNFKIGEVDLDISEEFTEGQKLAAGQKITKQPYVENTGTVPQLFFVEVSVPVMNATFLDSSGQRIAPDGVDTATAKAADYKQNGEIYNLLAENAHKGYVVQPTTISEDVTKNWELSYNTNNTTSGNESAGWIYLEQTETNREYTGVSGMRDGTYNTYLFGYTAFVEPGEQTNPLFDKLQLRSIVDADIDGDTLTQVQISAYTIQADSLDISGLTGNGSLEEQYKKEDLEKIYAVIENKESGS